MAKSNVWFIYILRCSDDTLYTGITTDLERRLQEHNANKSVTKYTRVRQPVSMIYSESVKTRSEAGQREAQIKKLKRSDKQLLASSFNKCVSTELSLSE